MMHFDDVARNPVNVSPGERSEPGFVGAAGENFEKNRARNAILQSYLCTPPLARQPPAFFLAPQAAGASLIFLMPGFLNGGPTLYSTSQIGEIRRPQQRHRTAPLLCAAAATVAAALCLR